MNKIFIIALIIHIAATTNALQISIDGNPDPVDSEVLHLVGGQPEVIGVYSDGLTPNGIFELEILGPSHFSIENAINTVNPVDGITLLDPTSILLDLEISGDPTALIPEGTVVNMIEYYGDELGDVALILMNYDTGMYYDTTVIHQLDYVPEPCTIFLLGLGGLLIRK